MPAIIATQTLLTEARKAYHALVTGTSPRVVVDISGERVEFAAANASRLYSYIQMLESQLSVACGTSPTANSNFHPAHFTF
jgi:hypothetical protein